MLTNAAALAALDQRLGELGLGDQPFLDQQLTELETRLLAQGDGSWVAKPHLAQSSSAGAGSLNLERNPVFRAKR